MLRSFIAFIIALTIAITGIVQPAYAASDSTYIASSQENGNFVYFNDSSQNFNAGVDDFFPYAGSAVSDSLGKMLDIAVPIILPVAICYIADTAATTVFPPAAGLAPFCPNMGTSVGLVGKAASDGTRAFFKLANQH